MSLPPPLPILWQDDDVVAVDKPENLAAIPESAGDQACLQMRLAAQLGTRLWVVHRLDKEVSGAILFAKNAAAHRCLNDQFAERETGKGYLALVHGVMERDEGAVDKRVHQFGSGRMGVDPRGKPSLTPLSAPPEAFAQEEFFAEFGGVPPVPAVAAEQAQDRLKEGVVYGQVAEGSLHVFTL